MPAADRNADLSSNLDWSTIDLDEDGRVASPAMLIRSDDLAGLDDEAMATAAAQLRGTGRVTVLIASDAPPPLLARAADVTLVPEGVNDQVSVGVADPENEARELIARIEGAPHVAMTLAWLLRGSENLTVLDAITAESAAYSTLLAGADFAAWKAARRPPRQPDEGERVRVERDGDILTITLTRPTRRNAVDRAMRNALADALSLALSDASLSVRITAEGDSFSAGGDLDEFGSATDQGQAHVVRVVASVGRTLHALRDRTTVWVFGACLGAGIEIPAFAGRIVARRDAFFGLPELNLGLIPGAGGTVSLPRRIGRQRTAWLALSGRRVDATTALRWGLVDELVDEHAQS
jgi:enoyl-CoA hydratase/carnithine racemase